VNTARLSRPLPGAERPAPRPRLRVAATVDHYLPGYKAGGSLRSVVNVAQQLTDALHLHVVTRDRDMGDEAPYPGVATGWTEVEGTPVRYLAPGERSAAAVVRVLREARPDVVYLNSVFSQVFTLQPLAMRKLGRLPGIPVVLAPRGELSEGALSIKRAKKLPFLRAARAAGLYRGVLWQASSELEAAEVRQWFGADARVQVAPDLRERPAPARPPAPKRPGALRAAFLSRISGKKNLAGALEMLGGVRGEVHLSIYGPVDDPAHWELCRRRITELPGNVTVDVAGPLPPEQVGEALSRHHLFLFPTWGENFGHVILEALLAGLPVLTSDRTPWHGLESSGAGWTLPLEQPERFTAVLQAYVDATADEHLRRSAAARALGEATARDESVLEANRALFHAAVQGR